MKKQNKTTFLATPLSELGIRKIVSWVNYYPRRLAKLKKELAQLNEIGKDPRDYSPRRTQLEKDIEAALVDMDRRPRTVREFIDTFHWKLSFNGRETCGLGPDTLRKFKVIVQKSALTPDDWPVLAKGDLLGKLSKNKIRCIHLVHIQPFLRYRDQDYTPQLEEFLDIKRLNDNPPSRIWALLTIRDLLKVDPERVAKPEYGKNFLGTHWNALIALRQKLAGAGFTSKDGPFMKWNPDKDSLVKAKRCLDGYKLTSTEVRRFAEIIVKKRWVV